MATLNRSETPGETRWWLLALMFAVTAPLMGWLAGLAWFLAMLVAPLFEGLPTAFNVLTGAAQGILPALWVAGLIVIWRDLGRDKLWFVRYSPWAIAGVFIWMAVATATGLHQGPFG